MRNSFLYGVVGVAIFVSLIHFFAVELKKVNIAYDNNVSQTISTVSSQLRYENELPNNLAESDALTETQKNNVSKYNVEYSRKNSSTYELCGNFKTQQDGKSNSSLLPYYGTSTYQSDIGTSRTVTTTDPYKHESGRVCFEYQITSSFFENSSNSSESFFDSDDFSSTLELR